MPKENSIFIDPTNDFGFKILYGFPECAYELKELIEHIIPEKKITSISYLPTESYTPEEDKKKIVCDVKCLDENGDYFIVEMQKRKYKSFPDRLMIYASHTAVKLLKKGENYKEVKTLYVISILDYLLTLPNDDPKYSKSNIRQAMVQMCDSGTVLSNKIKYIFLQLPLGNPSSTEWTERWSWHMQRVADADSKPLFTDEEDTHFDRLYTRAERNNVEKHLLQIYDDMIRDERQIQEEKEWAVEEALEKGREEGREEGITLGREEVARNLKESGFPADVIASCTGLSLEQIEKL